MDKKIRTPKETVAAIVADAESMDIFELHSKYGVKQPTIRAILQRYGIKPQKPNPNRFLIPKEKLENVLANGWLSVKDLANACECSYATVKKSLVAHGILQGRKPTTRNRIYNGTRAFKVLGFIVANPNLDLEAVAKQFNCTREYVGQIEGMARSEGIIK